MAHNHPSDRVRRSEHAPRGPFRLFERRHGLGEIAERNLLRLQRVDEAKALLRRTIPVTRRVLGESNDLTLRMRWNYTSALLLDEGATLDDFREAVETLESVAPLWKRVFGQSHPETPQVYGALNQARAALREAGGA